MRRTPLATILVAVTPQLSMASPPVITTVAGGGPDGVPAMSVNISLADIVADGSGNIYFPSSIEHRIFRIDPSGTLSLLAGTGIEVSMGDGGSIDRASFLMPTALALAPDGDPIVFEGVMFETCCGPRPSAFPRGLKVRRLDIASGIMDHLAGAGVYGFESLLQPAASARMGAPSDIVVSADGAIHVAEWYIWSNPFGSCFGPRGAVHGIDPAAAFVSHVAGNLSECGGPLGDGSMATHVSLLGLPSLALHLSGDLLASDPEHGRIRRVDRTTGTISTYAGNGSAESSGDGSPALAAGLVPGPLATDGAGNLFLCEGSRIRRVDSTTGIITTVAGNGTLGSSGDGSPATEAQIRCAFLSADPAANLYLAEMEGSGPAEYRIRRVDAATGIIQTIAGDPAADFFGDGGPAVLARLRLPADVELAPDGDLIIADAGHRSIRRVDAATGRISGLLAGSATRYGSRISPFGLFGLALHPDGTIYYAEKSTPDDFTDHMGQDYIFRLDPATGAETRVAGFGFPFSFGDGGPAEDAGIARVEDLEFDAQGNLFLAESHTGLIRRIDAVTGIITRYAGTLFQTHLGDGGPALEAGLIQPSGVAIDPAGNLLIADTGHHRIRRVDAATGIITTVAGNGTAGFSGDGGSATDASITAGRVAVDAMGNIYISGDGRVRRVDAATGIIQTIAGDGTFGFYGDGGHPTLAALGGPMGLDVDAAGNVYLAGAGRIRKITQELPAEIDVTVTPSILWPPGHHMRDVHASVTPSFGFSPVEIVLESIVSSEPDDAPGNSDGRTVGDIEGADIGQADFDFSLRAERDGNGEGRSYAVTYRATDEDGDIARDTSHVVIPHSQGGRAEPLELFARQTQDGTLLEWLEVPGARYYDAVRGELFSLHEAAGTIVLGTLVCVEAGSEDASTMGFEDAAVPPPGSGYFYLVEYDDGRRSGFGSVDAGLPRAPASGGCR